MSKRTVGWVTGVLTVGGAVEALTINNVNAGWGWILTASAVTLLLAVLAGWLAYKNQSPSDQPQESPFQQGESSDAASVTVGDRARVGNIEAHAKGMRGRRVAAIRIGKKARVRDIKATAEGSQPGDGTLS